MIPIFPDLPHQLGVYTLTRLLELRANTALYEAHQPHVERAVVLEVLSPSASHDEEVHFLAQARLRVASSELPHVAQVYESQCIEGHWLLSQELPRGKSLADLAADGWPLSVPHLCNIIRAAAEMYELCGMVELNAMPLASSSIYVETQDIPHFLSPLAEGESYTPQQQMQALAAALWRLLPQQQESGLGRVSTLLQWLHEGYEGEWLSWKSIGDTASTILNQLETSRKQAAENTLHHKLTHNRLLLKTRQFIRMWGTYLCVCCTLIITLTCLGSLFGIAEPQHLAAASGADFRCHQDGKDYRLSSHPVTVAEYAQFLQEFAAAPEAEQSALLEQIPVEPDSLEPENWDQQQNHPEAPVCGVTYWQAHLCAAFRGGELPSANLLQLLLQQKLSYPCLQEWSRTEMDTPLPEIYDGKVYLLIDAAGNVSPVSDRNWSAPTAGFRIAFPE
ncbi:MAG: hypothetical protein IKV13_09035 [Akkermansia sp.]|nr:hypothetical protein [Akkermansia sp.]